MSLLEINDEPAQDPQSSPSPVTVVEPKVFRGITVDTEYTPSSALLTWVEGSNWSVDYYSQILGADNEPTPQALDRDPIYQSYRRIIRMDLKVTTPLNFTQDPTLRHMDVTGSAITFPFLVPNVGDMFTADIGDGRTGVFTITNASRATILRDSVYNIDYVMVDELTASRQADLDSKTVEKFHYSRDSLYRGGGPFLTDIERHRQKTYRETLLEMRARYFTDFLSQEHSTLLVPDQAAKTYDHFVTRACLALFNSKDDPRIRRVRELNVSAEAVMQQPTLWDALLRTDDARLYGATEKATLLSTSFFKGRPTLQAIGYTGIPYLVFPFEPGTDVDAQYDAEVFYPKEGHPFKPGEPRRPITPYRSQAERNPIYFQRRPPLDGVDPSLLPPDIHPVTKDEYYVFSEAFYRNNTAGQSKLELMVWEALTHRAINLVQLDAILERVYDWDNLERFYYYPVLFVLLTLAQRGR